MKKTYFLSSLLTLFSLIILAGCQPKEQLTDYPVLDKSQPIIVTDSGILKELAFMRDEKNLSIIREVFVFKVLMRLLGCGL